MGNQLTGFLYGLCAYFLWGVLPIYWKQFPDVESLEVLCHRIIWGFGFIAVILFFDGTLVRLVRELKPSIWKRLLLSGSCIGSNWLVYVWAVQSGHIVDASLGYFISPLVMASIGVFVLKERLRSLQKAAIFIASIGVVWLTVSLGEIPWIGLWLAFTFSIYSLVRKTTKISSLGGLLIETLFLFLPSFFYLVYLNSQNSLALLHRGISMDFLLVGCGIATVLPLWWFAHAATRMKLASLGLMQYIAPILQFLLGVLLYEEVFSTDHLMGFSMIWLGLILYVWEQARSILGKHSAPISVEVIKNPLQS